VAMGILGASAEMRLWSIFGLPTCLKPRGTVPEDLDWICTLFTPTVAGVQPRGKRQDHNHEGTAECRNEEKKSELCGVNETRRR